MSQVKITIRMIQPNQLNIRQIKKLASDTIKLRKIKGVLASRNDRRVRKLILLSRLRTVAPHKINCPTDQNKH